LVLEVFVADLGLAVDFLEVSAVASEVFVGGVAEALAINVEVFAIITAEAFAVDPSD
jgi:hypothetical protein